LKSWQIEQLDRQEESGVLDPVLGLRHALVAQPGAVNLVVETAIKIPIGRDGLFSTDRADVGTQLTAQSWRARPSPSRWLVLDQRMHLAELAPDDQHRAADPPVIANGHQEHDTAFTRTTRGRGSIPLVSAVGLLRLIAWPATVDQRQPRLVQLDLAHSASRP
jgi:hypothetical protein